MNIPLFTIIAGIILLSAGCSLIIFLIKSIVNAIGISVPRLALPNLKEKRAEVLIKKRLTALESAKESKDFLLVEPSSFLGDIDFIDLKTHLEIIPLLTKLHLFYFESLLSYIEGNRIHFDRIGVLEALFGEKESLLTALSETLRTEKKVLNSKSKDPKNWALTEIEKQKKELFDDISSNAKELRQELGILLETLSSELKKNSATLH